MCGVCMWGMWGVCMGVGGRWFGALVGVVCGCRVSVWGVCGMRGYVGLCVG